MGDRARLSGLNIIGMQRRGFTREEIQELRGAFQMLFGAGGTISERIDGVSDRFARVKPVQDVLAFLRAESSRGICQPDGNGG
jgi:UDP-N-acetylglucosamine acyltransferase